MLFRQLPVVVLPKFSTYFTSFRRLATNTNTTSTSSLSSLVKPLTLRTCVGIYPRLASLHPRIFPEPLSADGLDLTVQYVDTATESDASSFDKTIVAIHGTPGSYSHFEHLIQHYRGSRVRVIAPNLPDFTHTRAHNFWHTTDEKLSFLRDFLRHLNITQIDCLASHSMGFQTTAALCESPGPDLKINSLAVFAPQPTWDLTVGDVTIIEKLFTFTSPIWYKTLELLRMHHQKRFAIMAFANIDEFLWLMASARDLLTPIDVSRRIGKLRDPATSSIPIIIQYGNEEKVIRAKTCKRLFEEFGLQTEHLIKLDPATGQTLNLKEKECRIQGIALQGAGHFAHAKYGDIANQIVDHLLEYYQTK